MVSRQQVIRSGGGKSPDLGGINSCGYVLSHVYRVYDSTLISLLSFLVNRYVLSFECSFFCQTPK